jgi:hypothetical protein
MSNKNHDFQTLVCIFAQLLPRIKTRAREHGYAIAIHGTMRRDLDLVAIPWVEHAGPPHELVSAIADEVSGYVSPHGQPGQVLPAGEAKPHGRQAWTIFWGGEIQIDLSVMPRIEKPTEVPACST